MEEEALYTEKSQNCPILTRIKGGHCTVLGLGISNRPLINVLLRMGAGRITVRDKNEKAKEEMMPLSRELEKLGVEFILGEKYLDGTEGDVIFRSPGIRPDCEPIVSAQKNGAVLTSEMELFVALTPAKIIGITGSDGKTTTTTLTYMMLDSECKRSGQGIAYVGGNIGKPLLEYADRMTKDDYAVLELSSFQLMTFNRSPEISAITNISPNHLDWHTGMNEYISAKCNIFSNSGARSLVLNADNGITASLEVPENVRVTYFSSSKHSYAEIAEGKKNIYRAIFERKGIIVLSDGNIEEEIIAVRNIKLPGRHNTENYMTAIGLTQGLVGRDITDRVSKTFGGVEHRLEFVRELDGVKYYNSSIDSSPSRTAAALSALECRPIVICGGYDKHIPFEPLAEALCKKAKAVVLTGATAQKIYDSLLHCPEYKNSGLEIVTVPDFADAVGTARKLAVPSDTVLLSPACASFDAFRNFEERGRKFKDIVNGF